MLANVYSNMGDHRLARKHYEAALSRIDMPGKEHQIYFDLREQNIALIGCSRALWCLGFPEQSLHMTHRAVAHARSTGRTDPVVIANSVLAHSFILMGDIMTAENFADQLVTLGERSANKLCIYVANGLRGYLEIRRGEVEKGCAMIRECLDALNLWSLSAWRDPYVCYLAEGLLAGSQFREAHVLIDATMELNTRWNQLFMMPEMLRMKGNVLAAMPDTHFAAAEDCFLRSLAMAEEQSALSWALRTATSLAQLYRSQARNDDALCLLAPIYDRFTEGFETADLKLAGQFLQQLRKSSYGGRCV
jgi:tetratricopeptide (TPR) repeat protein